MYFSIRYNITYQKTYMSLSCSPLKPYSGNRAKIKHKFDLKFSGNSYANSYLFCYYQTTRRQNIFKISILAEFDYVALWNVKTLRGSLFGHYRAFFSYFGHMISCAILKIWSLRKSGHIGQCIYLRCINRWRRCWYTWTSRRHGSEAKSRNGWIRIPWFTSIYSLPRIDFK